MIATKNLCTRIVIKFYDDLPVSHLSETGIHSFILGNVGLNNFFTVHPYFRLERLFTSLSPESITGLIKKARAADVCHQATDLLTYYVISCTENIDSAKLFLELAGLKEIELAYLQTHLINPAAIHETDYHTSRKGYLDPSPAGVNARHAWKIKGGQGIPNVKFIDIEQGWILNHEAIAATPLPLTGISDPGFRDHGAAVLGVIAMKENGRGGPGIAPAATGHVISQWRPDGAPNDADAILTAISYLDAGDILLLEMQSFHSTTDAMLWPTEINDASFQVIRLATALGIIVIEAAGNGNLYTKTGNDLDLFSVDNKYIFNPDRQDFRDSGAVMVAAASAELPHRRTADSNHGKRINCFAWGEGVITAGSYPASSESAINTYTRHFNGTSSASAIIAGVAIVVQSILEANHRPRFSPKQMRDILSNELYGTTTASGTAKDKIGIMPDLKKIIDNCLLKD